MGNRQKRPLKLFLIRLMQGALIGLGAVLPGISGGVLCVVFGIYQPIMELLSHPFRALKKHAEMLLPVLIGLCAGFLGIAKLLGFLLNRYPDASVCLFAGLIIGMLPSLFREGRKKGSSPKDYAALGITFAVVLALLMTLRFVSVSITANAGWYVFCGFCLALSIIAPGMSFSTLLMPLGLYTPFVEGIGNFDFSVLIPGGIGAVVTVILFARLVNRLLDRYYSTVSHAIIGIVIAATLPIIPYAGFVSSVTAAIVNTCCLTGGVAAALLLDHVNSKVEVPE
ncbi:MAG: DUF368 domain-containing protein [Oscillospiraceae bacterium]|nr:DUF368 domain-containing protein [Oscillospiraceae bacterium]MDY3065527.1 DUF368 domain-containing protein [Oscillospiraceae bacterium]